MKNKIDVIEGIDHKVQMVELFKSFRLKEQNPAIAALFLGILDSKIDIFHFKNDIYIVGLILFIISIISSVTNEYSDKDTDNNRVDKKASNLHAYYFWPFFILISILIFYLTYSYTEVHFILFAAYLSGVLYSIPKIRLKNIVILDQISVALSYVVLPYLAIFSIANINVNYITLIYLLFFLGSANLIALSKDYEADKAAKLKNTIVYFGYKNIMKTGMFFSFVFIISGFFVYLLFDFKHYYFFFIFGMYLLYFFRKGVKTEFETYQTELISKTVKGIKAGWYLILYLLIFILFQNGVFGL